MLYDITHRGHHQQEEGEEEGASLGLTCLGKSKKKEMRLNNTCVVYITLVLLFMFFDGCAIECGSD